tara:strand:- start:1719 stop:1991 length:273 start_codon:yes stop_codon:yes gene_type:complete
LPPDGQLLWSESIDPFQRLRRYFQAKAFYKTLKAKLDQEERRWREAQQQPEPSTEYLEHPPDGTRAQRLLGGMLQIRSRFFRRDDNLRSR